MRSRLTKKFETNTVSMFGQLFRKQPIEGLTLDETALYDSILHGKCEAADAGTALKLLSRARGLTDEERTKIKSKVSKVLAKESIVFTRRPFCFLERDFDKGVGAHGRDRDTIPASDFAGPHRSFPITSPGDVSDAKRLAGHAANPSAVKAKIKKIAKRKGFKASEESQDSDNLAFARDKARFGTIN